MLIFCRKILNTVILLTLLTVLTSCSAKKSEDQKNITAVKDIKIGIVLIGDESDTGYSYNHMLGLIDAVNALGVSLDNITVKRNIVTDNECLSALRELADNGADIIFATSYEYEPFMLSVAADYPHIEFCHASGHLASDSDLSNVHNYFPKIHEARYLAGIAAGLKAKELNNPKLGYIAAFELPEVISGFSAFYLGAKSVYPAVTMDVIYTSTWGDADLESAAIEELIAGGCQVISQHSDTNAPAQICESLGAFHVGYNADMIPDAPHASLVSARMDWGIYYKYAIEQIMKDESISLDWSGGLFEGAVYLSPLNEEICAAGTDAAIQTAKEAIETGFKVFGGPLTGIDSKGGTLDLKSGEFYDESGKQSAPSFHYIIDGINVQR